MKADKADVVHPSDEDGALEPKKPKRAVKFQAAGVGELVKPVHDDLFRFYAALEGTTGAGDPDLALPLINQVIRAVPVGATSNSKNPDPVEQANIAAAMVHGIGPRDELEGMLAAQMATAHMLAMDLMARATQAKHTETAERELNQATKLLRTFTAQMEALKRYRSRAKQTVIVKHVHVHEGGQAIVGDVNRGGRDEK